MMAEIKNVAKIAEQNARLTNAIIKRAEKEMMLSLRAIAQQEIGQETKKRLIQESFKGILLKHMEPTEILAQEGYARSRAGSKFAKLGESPTMSEVVTGIDSRRLDVQDHALEKITRILTSNPDISSKEVQAAISGATRSAISDVSWRAQKDLAAADRRRTNMKTPRVIRVPKSEGCDFCKVSSASSDGEFSFHKGCSCAAVTVFDGQTVNSDALDEGRAKFLAAKAEARASGEEWRDPAVLMRSLRKFEDAYSGDGAALKEKYDAILEERRERLAQMFKSRA